MPTVTNDGNCFSIDGRRVWLVSGTVHYARVAKELWRPRLAAAKQAGLNCIETPIIWGLHEPNPGSYVFDGSLDVRSFLKMVGEFGMHAIVRIGPYVGDGYDLGGLPSWIIPTTEGRLRMNDQSFLSACSRFFTALGEQIADLQVTHARPGATTPILLLQNEHNWFCGDGEMAHNYLGELIRYLRETGFDVPILNRNNLFQSVEKEIDTWGGFAHLHSITRQLKSIDPDNPSIIGGLEVSAPDVWGSEVRSKKSPQRIIRAAAEVLAAGGQFNVTPFHAGTNFGHFGGRLESGPDAFCTTDASRAAPLLESGQRTDSYAYLKRICTFASTFSQVFAASDAGQQALTISPESTAPPIIDEETGEEQRSPAPAWKTELSCVHLRGTQGEVVFIFGDGYARPKARTIPLLLRDGSTRDIAVGQQGVAWVTMNTHLHGKSTLDYCTFCAFARVGKVFVCYGPAGASGLLSINGAELGITAPTGSRHEIIEHEDTVVVICNETSIDETYVSSKGVFLNAQELDTEGNPIPVSARRPCRFIATNGHITKPDRPATATRKTAPTLGQWLYAGTESYVDGSSERFATIDGPSSMEGLGMPSGYGWIRLTFRSGAAKKLRAGLFESADRLHLYFDGAFQGIVGRAPGAQWGDIGLNLKKRPHTLTMLVDNLGRTSGGSGMGEPKGLYGHIWEVAPFKAGAPRLEEADGLDPGAVHKPFFGLHQGERTDSHRLTWSFMHRKKTPIILLLDHAPAPGVLVLNGEPVRPLIPGCINRVVLSEAELKRGNNVLQVTFVCDMKEAQKDIKAATTFYEGVSCMSEKATWAFAKWEMPEHVLFEAVKKTDMQGRSKQEFKGGPAWWKTQFELTSVPGPLYFDASGLSKGRIYLNGRDVGRYFVANRDGTPVPPQTEYYLPEPWLRTVEPNELILFDEHGFAPGKCKLVWK